MKITKRQIRRIIKEEKAKVVNEMYEQDDPYMEAMHDLYDALERTLTAAKKAGIDYPDLMTAFDDAKESVGY